MNFRTQLLTVAAIAIGLFTITPLLAKDVVMVKDPNHPKVELTIKDANLPNIVIVSTGGTIAEKINASAGGAVPALSGSDLVAAVPSLSKMANIGTVNFCNIDSSHMTPDIWAQLSRTVDAVLSREDVAGVVVTHGTDTMAEGAWFLDITLQSDKPVVFTGAMRDASDTAPDGPGNLQGAVAQVISPNAQGWGVTVTLNQYINSARDVLKTQTTNVQTFQSFEMGYLGYVVGNKTVNRFNDRLYPIHIPLHEPLPKVYLLTMFAGDDGSLIRAAINEGAQGLVYSGVGAGNVNPPTMKAIEYALSKKIPVVICTRVFEGDVEPIYGDDGGGADLLKHNCILSPGLDGPKARILLMLAVAHYGNDAKALKKIFTD
ncbi:MAG: asparaginase [Planctomycetes bacterium]|nr:asparaginase [Planctomycetota bacterium]